jgi:thiaminase
VQDYLFLVQFTRAYALPPTRPRAGPFREKAGAISGLLHG